jgi:hypothetical protein
VKCNIFTFVIIGHKICFGQQVGGDIGPVEIGPDEIGPDEIGPYEIGPL